MNKSKVEKDIENEAILDYVDKLRKAEEKVDAENKKIDEQILEINSVELTDEEYISYYKNKKKAKKYKKIHEDLNKGKFVFCFPALLFNTGYFQSRGCHFVACLSYLMFLLSVSFNNIFILLFGLCILSLNGYFYEKTSFENVIYTSRCESMSAYSDEHLQKIKKANSSTITKFLSLLGLLLYWSTLLILIVPLVFQR